MSLGRGGAERRRAGAIARPLLRSLNFEGRNSRRWKSRNLVLIFDFTIRPSSAERWECGNLAGLWRDFQKGSWKEGAACCWLPTLSTAPAFPQLSPLSFFTGGFAPRAWLVATTPPKTAQVRAATHHW